MNQYHSSALDWAKQLKLMYCRRSRTSKPWPRIIPTLIYLIIRFTPFFLERIRINIHKVQF